MNKYRNSCQFQRNLITLHQFVTLIWWRRSLWFCVAWQLTPFWPVATLQLCLCLRGGGACFWMSVCSVYVWKCARASSRVDLKLMKSLFVCTPTAFVVAHNSGGRRSFLLFQVSTQVLFSWARCAVDRHQLAQSRFDSVEPILCFSFAPWWVRFSSLISCELF